jgi:hypothetical protein
MNINHNTITPLLHLIKAGYKTNTGERHLKGRRLGLFYLTKWSIIVGAWALLSFITYLIIS